MSIKRRIYVFCVVLLISGFLVSCGSDETRFSKDPLAVDQTRKLGAKLDSGQRLSSEEFESLKTTFESFPTSKSVRTQYEKALVKRKDWATLAEFYKTSPEAEMGLEQKRNFAKVHLNLGRYAEAYKIASEFDVATDKEMRTAAATSLFYLGKYEEAKKLIDTHWERILKDKGADEMVARGMIHFYAGENSKAVEILEKVTEFDPGHITANNSLSRVYFALGEKEKARAAVNKVQESFDALTQKERVQTRNVERLYRLENAYKAKRYDEVIVLGNQLIPETSGRNRSVIYQYLYNSYRALGRENDARDVMEKAKGSQQK